MTSVHIAERLPCKPEPASPHPHPDLIAALENARAAVAAFGLALKPPITIAIDWEIVWLKNAHVIRLRIGDSEGIWCCSDDMVRRDFESLGYLLCKWAFLRELRGDHQPGEPSLMRRTADWLPMWAGADEASS